MEVRGGNLLVLADIQLSGWKKAEPSMSHFAANSAGKNRHHVACNNGSATWGQEQGAEPCQTEPAAADTVAFELAAIGTLATEPNDFSAASDWDTTNHPDGPSPIPWLPPRPAPCRLRTRIMTTRHQIIAVLATVLVTYTAGLSLLSLLVELVP
jgi:hypothetical protein